MTPSSATVSSPGAAASRVLLVARPTDPTGGIIETLDRAALPWNAVASTDDLPGAVTSSTRTVLVAHPELADDTLRILDAIDAGDDLVVLVVGNGDRPPLARPDLADALSRATGWQLMTLDRPVRRSLLAGLVRAIDRTQADRTPTASARRPDAASGPTATDPTAIDSVAPDPASRPSVTSSTREANDVAQSPSTDASAETEPDRVALQRRVEELEAEVDHLQGTVAKRTRRVRRMAQKLADAEHAERERIAQVLHDNLQQVLYGAQMLAQTLTEESEATTGDETVREAAERIDEMLEQATSLTRTLVSETYPPVLAGADVRPILNWLALHAERTYGLEVDVNAGAVALPDRSRRTLLFQILRELLFNVVKHSGQDRAVLRTRYEDGALVAEVEDRGSGFDADRDGASQGHASNGGFGLMSIRERVESLGGCFEMTSTPGNGTCVTVSLPNAEPAGASSDESVRPRTTASEEGASEGASGAMQGSRNRNGEHHGDGDTPAPHRQIGGSPDRGPGHGR